MPVCKRVIYRGRVQGVGFRYTARRLAAGLTVGGHVKNLPDGAVELLVEGEPAEVEELLARIVERMADYIADADVRDEPPTGLRDFEIAY